MTTARFAPWNFEAVFRAFGELTGIVFRVQPEEMKRQAQRFAETFTLAELETVVLWTKKQIADQAGGLNPQSLTWRILMGSAYGDEFIRFQERLGLANEAIRRRAFHPRLTLSAPPPAAAKAAPAPREPAADPEAIRKHAQQGFGDLLKTMGRK